MLAACVLLAGCEGAEGPGSTISDRADAVAGQYVLQPGDRVEIRPVLDGPYATVSALAPDGTIAVPGVPGRVEAGGKTIPQLGQELAALYRKGKILDTPLITINLLELADRQVFVGGEVGRPGAIALHGPSLSVMQAVVARGGPMATGRLDDVLILRVEPNGALRLFSVNLRQVLSGEDLTQNAFLQPMDVVLVPKTQIARIDLLVDQYIRQVSPVPLAFAFRLTNGPIGILR